MRFFVFLFLQSLVFFAAAQSIDVGISLGGSNYSGDLTPNAIAAIKQTGLAGGIHLRYDFSNAIAFKLQYMRLSVKGDDSYGKQDWYRLRNASFIVLSMRCRFWVRPILWVCFMKNRV
ncbi:MAG: hypothetical protein IPM86_01415 [Saprospiraceae bacterium]|nr:hypothetical protein [Saprospiraceae bacterium]